MLQRGEESYFAKLKNKLIGMVLNKKLQLFASLSSLIGETKQEAKLGEDALLSMSIA